MSKTAAIYRAYVTRDNKTTAQDIADTFGVTRRAVHQAVKEIRDGSKVKLCACMENIEKECKWQSKYLPWFAAIAAFRGNKALTADFQYMLRCMKKDKFTTADIARYTGKDHATIRYHLSKK